MPPWLEKALEQAPFLAICLAAVFFAVHYITRQNNDREKAIQARHEEEVKLLVAAYDKHLASKEAEIDRLVKEKEQLLKSVTGQQKKP